MKFSKGWALAALLPLAACDDGGGGDPAPDEGLAADAAVTPDEGVAPDPDGATPDPDGAIPDPDGAVPDPDAAVPDPDAAIPDPDAEVPVEPMAPTSVEMVVNEGFTGPMDAVASPDGEMFYFSAYDVSADVSPDSSAAIFATPSQGGDALVLFSGPPLQAPTGLLMNCDGTSVYVADMGFSGREDPEDPDAALYTLDLGTNMLSALRVDGVAEAASLAFNEDCSTLYITGYTEDGLPAVFTTSPEGGEGNVLAQGQPLESPSGVFVDEDQVAWVMDHLPSNPLGGALFAITADGEVSPVVEDLQISEPAGVSLVAEGRIAVIPNRNADGEGELKTVDTETGAETTVEAPLMLEPAGIRTAKRASVLAVVDADGDAIFRAE